jgi:hypothetical protein
MTQHEWRKRYGKANEHYGMVPRDWWLEGWEKQAILGCHAEYRLNLHTGDAVVFSRPTIPLAASRACCKGSTCVELLGATAEP